MSGIIYIFWGEGILWTVLNEEGALLINGFERDRYVAQAWKDENNIVAQLSLRE